jgi:5-methylcytosine-specific restriction endonuclease McrA
MLDLDSHDDTLPAHSAPAEISRSGDIESYQTLILNADYSPIKTMGWKKAFNGLVRGIMHPVSHYDVWIRSPSQRYQLPSVAALNEFTDVYRPAPLTRRNLMLVYRMRCALCGAAFKGDDLTREHLHPRSRGGDNSWTNLVPACQPCNQEKGNRTLAEAGITLKIPLKPAPTGLDVLRARLSIEFAEPPHPSWNDYIGQAYWDAIIDG